VCVIASEKSSERAGNLNKSKKDAVLTIFLEVLIGRQLLKKENYVEPVAKKIKIQELEIKKVQFLSKESKTRKFLDFFLQYLNTQAKFFFGF
jgi:hypothetical protein